MANWISKGKNQSLKNIQMWTKKTQEEVKGKEKREESGESVEDLEDNIKCR